jgi:hypothetical protein
MKSQLHFVKRNAQLLKFYIKITFTLMTVKASPKTFLRSFPW